jgi:hypothetical protein
VSTQELERRQEEIPMSRTGWIRLGSLAALVGGSIAVFFAGLDLMLATAQLLDEQSPLGLALFRVQVATTEAAPVLWLFFLLAVIGLQVRGAGRAGMLGVTGISVAAVGAGLAGLSNGLNSVIIYSQAGGCRIPLDCDFYDPNHYLVIGFILELLGSPIFGLGMILYGIVALRRHVLSYYNGLPLAVGAMALVNVAVSVSAMLAATGTDYAGTQKVEIVLAAVALGSATVWVLLGAALWPREHEETGAQVVQAEPAV